MKTASANKLFDECMTEMFSRVGLKYRISYCKDADWFRKKTWTAQEEKSFHGWLTKRLRKARMLRPEYEASMFILNYGWIAK